MRKLVYYLAGSLDGFIARERPGLLLPLHFVRPVQDAIQRCLSTLLGIVDGLPPLLRFSRTDELV